MQYGPGPHSASISSEAGNTTFYLNSFGPRSLPCTLGIRRVLSRHAATRAGLGEFGYKNALLTPQFGPRQRINSVLTDAELAPDPCWASRYACATSAACA